MHKSPSGVELFYCEKLKQNKSKKIIAMTRKEVHKGILLVFGLSFTVNFQPSFEDAHSKS